MTDEEAVKKRILRAAKAMHNACKKTFKESMCRECPFCGIGHTCNLYNPIVWGEKISEVK